MFCSIEEAHKHRGEFELAHAKKAQAENENACGNATILMRLEAKNKPQKSIFCHGEY